MLPGPWTPAGSCGVTGYGLACKRAGMAFRDAAHATPWNRVHWSGRCAITFGKRFRRELIQENKNENTQLVKTDQTRRRHGPFAPAAQVPPLAGQHAPGFGTGRAGHWTYCSGADHDAIDIFKVPGAFENPLMAKKVTGTSSQEISRPEPLHEGGLPCVLIMHGVHAERKI